MYKSFYQKLIQFPLTILFLALFIAAFSVWEIQRGLFEDGKFQLDTSHEPFLHHGDNSAFDFYKSIETRGFDNNLTPEEQKVKVKNSSPGNVVLALKLPNSRELDLQYFLNLDLLHQNLKT